MMNKEKEKFTKEKYEQWQQSCFYVSAIFAVIIGVSGGLLFKANIAFFELFMRVTMSSIALSFALYGILKIYFIFSDFFSGLNTYGRYFWQELNTEEEKPKNSDGYFAPFSEDSYIEESPDSIAAWTKIKHD